jgi:dTDP-glucose 4,6-dehydratase/UDP-glucuronate decarboxylase
MDSNHDILLVDLEYICTNLGKELETLSGNRLLLTGGAGFLGYYIVQSLLHWNKISGKNEKIDLTVFDNYIRGVPPWLHHQEATDHLTLVKHDITCPLPAEMNHIHYPYIIHAASIASPIYYRKHPIETMDANVNGLRLLLEYCMQQQANNRPVKGFLFFSSSEVYGNPSPENIPTSEDYHGYVSFTGPRACYDESKRYGETLCVNFTQVYDLPIKIARPFNNYGPGLKITDRRVLPDFARNILAGENIELLSDGKPTRTFCYVADAVVGYIKILVNGQKGQAYNIGVERPEISMADLAKRVVDISKDLFGYQGEVIFRSSSDQNYLTDNPDRRCPNISKARNELGYNPQIDLDEGLRRTLIRYRNNAEGEDV